MKKIILAGACVFTLALAIAARPAAAQSSGAPLEFTADAVQSLPGAEIQTGKLFVSRTATRFEYQQNGRPIIQIIYPDKGLMRIIFPLKRAYMEYKALAGKPLPGAKPATPCPSAKLFKCNKLGDTKINGLIAERWSITSQRSRAQARIWWDAKRRITLRQEYSDGRIMQATLRGMQKFEDRDVENWEFVYTSPSGSYRRAMSLISPKLGLTIIEQLPNGASRRLHNIKTGAPDAKLFDLPKDFKLIPQPRQANNRFGNKRQSQGMPSGAGRNQQQPTSAPLSPAKPHTPAQQPQPTIRGGATK